MRRPLAAALPLLALAALALPLVLAGCRAPESREPVEDYRLAAGFEKSRPADVAVLAIEGNLPQDAAEALREALRKQLLDRRYAPVRVKEIDGRLSEFRPGGANAVLTLAVARWDDEALQGAGTLRFSGSLRLTGPGSADPLYAVVLRDVAVDARASSHRMEERPRVVEAAADEVAGRLLARLPRKGD